MNVGTMTTTATADPVLALPADGATTTGEAETGGFAAVLRDADAAAEPAVLGTAGEPVDDAPGDAAEAVATELLMVLWQRSTTTGLAGTAQPAAPSSVDGAATPPSAEGVPVAGVATSEAPLVPIPVASTAHSETQGPALGQAAVLPEAEAAPDRADVDLLGMQAVPETPLEAVDLGTSTPGDDQDPHQAPSEGGARLATAAASGPVPATTPATTGAATTPSASAVTAATAPAADMPAADAPAADAPAVDPTAQAVPQAPARVDALAGPTATIRADELQRAIADTARQLADQGGGRHRINVRITSPDLGQVVVEIVSRGSEVRVTLQPQDAGVGGSLQQQHQAVARALATEGFNLSGFDVHTGHPDGRHREDDPQQQGIRTLDDELVDLTTIDDGALRL